MKVQLRSATGKAFGQAELVVDTFGEWPGFEDVLLHRSKAGKSFDTDERWICRAILCFELAGSVDSAVVDQRAFLGVGLGESRKRRSGVDYKGQRQVFG